MLVCAALPLKAQYTLRGTVTDSLTKEPLLYTSVYLKGTTEGGMTDNEGTSASPSASSSSAG